MENIRWRNLLASLGVVLAVCYVMPNVANMEKIPWWPIKDKINYGLDIQGGLHLVMGVDIEGVVAESVQKLIVSLREDFKKDQINFVEINSSNPKDGQINLQFASADEKAKAQKYFSEKYPGTLQELSSQESSLVLRYFDTYMTDYKDKVIQQSIETIRNRIDEFGVAEPSISRQGANRILVQLPGMADAERAKELINATAKLDFMIVSHEKSPEELRKLIEDAEKAGGYNIQNTKYTEYVSRLNQDLANKLPEKTVIYFSKAEGSSKMELGAVPMLLKTDSNLGGKDLDDARVGYGQYGEPEVSLRFSPSGSTVFADLTGANVGKQMAIVLDKVVKSAPNLKEKISGGSARISMGGRDYQKNMDEAKMISTALRAGALPASLDQLEERRVGPTLGSDSIKRAKLGSYVGALLVILFMTFYYRTMGVIATVSLGINILSVFALLSSLGATLTLPGIAGIALTVGFAVDANVLINERIKEELHKGSSLKMALQEGYHRAMSAILDANVTVAATAFVLLYFGTGPVRGFAVTLLIGILTTLFANVFVSKVIVDNLVLKFGLKKISV